MLNIAICDDEVLITGKIEMLVHEIARRNLVEVDTEVFWNGKSLLQAMKQGINFDIIYLLKLPTPHGVLNLEKSIL